jgi:hypothetical protein
MIASATQVASASTPAPAAAAQTNGAAGHGFSFHDVLSAINPLQYLPVVGTVYRAITGDVIPEPLRRAGSLVASVLMGGPIGLAIYAGTTLLEKASGLDPEKIGQALLTHPGSGNQMAAAHGGTQAPAATPSPAAMPPDAPTSAAPSQAAFTQEQLAAYGIRPEPQGSVASGNAGQADALNGMEMVRLDRAATAYAAMQAMPLRVAAMAA